MSESGRGGKGREKKGQRDSTLLLILFRTVKFSIQHVSPVMRSGRGGGNEREREREVDGC